MGEPIEMLERLKLYNLEGVVIPSDSPDMLMAIAALLGYSQDEAKAIIEKAMTAGD